MSIRTVARCLGILLPVVSACTSGAGIEAEARAAGTRSVGKPTGEWAEFVGKDGAFVAAICVVGSRPSIGHMFSPEHSSTRDRTIVTKVPCPPALPAAGPPVAARQALSLRRALEFSGGPRSADGPPLAELVTVVKAGASRSTVRTDSGEALDVENARLIGLGGGSSARPGDFVLSFHPEIGVTRALVVEDRTAATVRLLRVRGFGSGYFGEFDVARTAVRRIDRDLDPGSLVAVPLADRIEVAMVVVVAGDFVVTLDSGEHIRTMHRSSVVPLPVTPRPTPGARVWVPVVDDLEPARVVDVGSVAITAVTESFPDSPPVAYPFGCFIDRDLSLGLYKAVPL